MLESLEVLDPVKPYENPSTDIQENPQNSSMLSMEENFQNMQQIQIYTSKKPEEGKDEKIVQGIQKQFIQKLISK